MSKENVEQNYLIADEDVIKIPLTELETQVDQLGRMIKKVDGRLERYETQMRLLKGLSDTVQRNVDLGLKVFDLSRDGNAC